jgi:hypothetical protein
VPGVRLEATWTRNAVNKSGAIPREAWILWTLSTLFLLRVLGQVLVVFAGATFLPPSREWYSGLIPYNYLLPTQIAILVVMTSVNLGVMNRRGFFTTRRPRFGWLLFVSSILYAAVMVVRYFVSGNAHPERRFWPPGSIPIVFHFVLAGYLYMLGRLARAPVSSH